MNVCRTCLITPATKDIITLENDINEDNKNCLDVMVFVLNIQVKPNSKITTNLCNNCYWKIISFYKFKALSLKNDAYLNSLDPVTLLEGQEHSLYVDENGIKHENFLDPDEFGPSVVGDCNTEIKANIELKNEVEADVEVDDHILGDIESDEEPLNVIQEIKYEFVKDDIKENAPINKKTVRSKDKRKDIKNITQGKPICKKTVRKKVKRQDIKDVTHSKTIYNKTGRKKVKRQDIKDVTHSKTIYNKTGRKKVKRQDIKDVTHSKTIYKKTGRKKVKRQDIKDVTQGKPKDIKDVIQGKQMCEECGMLVLDLKQHCLRHQPKEERTLLQCKACPKMFLTRGGRRRHYKSTHLGLKPKCDICNKEVLHLSTHKLQMHDQDAAPFGCASCERRFVSRGALERHVLAHTEDRAIECDICHGKFRTKDYVANHIRRVHNKERNHQCEICSKAFFDKNLLQFHLSTHSKERQFICTECGKALTSKDSLRHHRLVHNDVRKYSCHLCDKSFKVQSYLRTHILSHTRKKAYQCQFCEARFGRVSSRRRHELSHHNAMSSNHKQ